jgi:SAM-dependent methyltransferase
MSLYKKRTDCAICNSSSHFTSIMDYGEIPLAGDFPSLKGDTKVFDLKLLYCNNCGLLQTSSIIDPEFLFKDYRYMSSIGLQNHFNKVAQLIKDKFNPKKVLEIGSNDGVLLKPLSDLGINSTGIDPAENITKIAKDKGCDVIVDFFNDITVKKHKLQDKFDFIVSNNCFAHIEDIQSIVKGIKMSLKKDGHFMFEVHYMKHLIDLSQYETVYHEHLYYYSLSALNYLFSSYNMTIVDVDEISIHGGSIRVVVKNSKEELPKKIIEFLQEESNNNLTDKNYLQSFGINSQLHIDDFKSKIKQIKDKGFNICGYGAAGRGNVFCNLCDLDESILDFIVDESPERKNRFTAGTNIPIVGIEELENSNIDYVLILAWNYSKTIINKLKGKNYKFIIAFPEFNIVDNSNELDNKYFH